MTGAVVAFLVLTSGPAVLLGATDRWRRPRRGLDAAVRRHPAGRKIGR